MKEMSLPVYVFCSLLTANEVALYILGFFPVRKAGKSHQAASRDVMSALQKKHVLL